MKALPLTLPLTLFAAGSANAHPGHLVDAAGHDHWVAGAAIGAAIAVGLWGALKGKRKTSESRDDGGRSEDRQEA